MKKNLKRSKQIPTERPDDLTEAFTAPVLIRETEGREWVLNVEFTREDLRAMRSEIKERLDAHFAAKGLLPRGQ